MRNLFLALVLANLGFAAWHAWWGAPEAPRTQAGEEKAGITLVKELEDAGAVGTAPGENGAAAEASESGAGGGRASGGGAEPPAVVARAAGPEADAGEAGNRVPATAAVGAEGEAGNRVPATAAGAEGQAERNAAVAAHPGPAARASTAAGGATGERGGGTPEDGAGSPDAGERCVSVGPFLDLGQATTASAKLRAAGYAPSQRAGEGEVWVGYWVYLDAIPSQEEANRILSTLHEHGVGEAYVFQGDDGKVISLGVFTEIARAGRLRDQVRELGFTPTVVDRTRREDVYWVDLLLGPGRQVDFETLQTPGRITRLEQRACEATRD